MSDVTVLGTGIRFPDQLTREAREAMLSTNEVLVVDPAPAVTTWLDQRGLRWSDLHAESYVEGEPREMAYRHMVARVWEAALDHGPVVFAMQGHPLVYAWAPLVVLEVGRVLGRSVLVLPGISAIDTILATLGWDPSIHGLQAYEATDLLLRRRPLRPEVPCLVWQAGVLGTLSYQRGGGGTLLDVLQAHLARFWPTEHPVHAVTCSPHALVPDEVRTFSLGALGQQRLHPGVTLAMAPGAVRPIQDVALMGRFQR